MPYNSLLATTTLGLGKPMTQSLQSDQQEQGHNGITMTRIRISGLKRYVVLLSVAATLVYLLLLLQPTQSERSAKKIAVVEDAPSWPLQIQNSDGRKSIYTPSMFTPEQASQNHYLPVTAVIQRVSDNEQGIQHVVNHLLKYPFVKEVYIYNHIPSRPINIQVRFTDTTRMISLFNLTWTWT